MTATGLRVYIDGTDVTCYALPPVNVEWGRDNPADGIEPRRAQLTVMPEAQAHRGSRLLVQLNAPATDPLWSDVHTTWAAQGAATWEGVRKLITVFTGTVTDTDTSWVPLVPHVSWQCSVQVLAVDPLGDLANQPVGDAPWPAESVTLRAQRIEALTTIPTWTTDPSALQVAARDVDRQPALGLLDDLAATASLAGGVFYDPNTDTGAFLLDASRTSTVPDLTLTGCNIEDSAHLAESVADVVNDCTVTYVNPADLSAQPEAHAVLAESVASDGRRYQSISTQLTDGTAAQARADQTVKRRGHSVPRWADVRLSSRTGITRAAAEALMKARPGFRVRIDEDVPAPAVMPWDGYLEGWALEATQDEFTVTVSLSPAVWSGPLLTWADVPTSATANQWQDLKAGWRWVDAVTELRWT